jgi:Protein of unknown function (DUF3619)
MNISTISPGTAVPSPAHHAALDTLQSRFALRVAARLTERCESLDVDVGERLRFAREKALQRAAAVRAADSTSPLGATSGGAALMGRGGGWWMKLASVLPAVALVAGLVLIQHWQAQAQISVAAEIDSALLSDDLPPRAYSDAGFAEFLKTPGE